MNSACYQHPELGSPGLEARSVSMLFFLSKKMEGVLHNVPCLPFFEHSAPRRKSELVQLIEELFPRRIHSLDVLDLCLSSFSAHAHVCSGTFGVGRSLLSAHVKLDNSMLACCSCLGQSRRWRS